MKHIFDNHRTRELLQKWIQNAKSTNVPLCVATFFFWNSGTALQKSLTGMLRTLFLQILGSYPQVIPLMLPITWAKVYARLLDSMPVGLLSEAWSLREVLSGFKILLTQQDIATNLCILIDGLDEFDGDHEELAELFTEIANNGPPNTKICLSSRPLPVFKDTFYDCPSCSSRI